MEYFSYGHSSIGETLDIVERGLRRLGITGDNIRMPKIEPLLVHEVKPFAEVTPAMIGEMIRLTGLNYSQAEIARQLGCSQSAVSKNLRRLGYHGVQGRRINRNGPRNHDRRGELQVA